MNCYVTKRFIFQIVQRNSIALCVLILQQGENLTKIKNTVYERDVLVKRVERSISDLIPKKPKALTVQNFVTMFLGDEIFLFLIL